jgi:hypothetical protein
MLALALDPLTSGDDDSNGDDGADDPIMDLISSTDGIPLVLLMLLNPFSCLITNSIFLLLHQTGIRMYGRSGDNDNEMR